MRPIRQQWLWLILSLALVTFALLGFRAYVHSPSRGLPYHDSFSTGQADEWEAFGGNWQLSNGAMRNDSDERGALLVTGSPYWHNMKLEADVSLIGTSGDAGLVIRSGSEEEGVNAYSGYYAGLRTSDDSLVLGRAEHGWLEARRGFPRRAGIRPFVPYHLELLAFECHIAASVTPPNGAERLVLAIEDPDCRQRGRIGLRSYSVGGVWRNVQVHPATVRDLNAMLSGTKNKGVSSPALGPIQDPRAITASELQQAQNGSPSELDATREIASLRLGSYVTPEDATVRGVVTMIAPEIVVQDATGGVYVDTSSAPALRIGDEVEVRGKVHPGAFSSRMASAVIKPLWPGTPMPPLSVTALQAATGKFDATFIEVQGELVRKERGPGNRPLLYLKNDRQNFRAILDGGRGESLFNSLRLGSYLQLSGICVIDPAFTQSVTPFAVIVGSNEEVTVLAGPPWWSAGHLIAAFLAGIASIIIAIFIYHRAEHWRLRVILEERGRLAHEMHDTLAQSFAGIGFQLQAIQDSLPEDLSPLSRQLAMASNLVRHSHEEARRSIAALQPELLQSGNIISALETCARRMVQGGAVRVKVEEIGTKQSIPVRIADTIFRIGQEAIANAVRHANATQITIRLEYQSASIRMLIEDDGKGFTPDSAIGGFGLTGMRKRARSAGAHFAIDSQPAKGTSITVAASWPRRRLFASWWQWLLSPLQERTE